MEVKTRVQAIDRAVSIMKLFNEDRRELKLSEISDALDLNKSTVHGIISTLKYHGLIDQDEETQKYRLGLFNMSLGELVQKSLDIRDVTTPVVDKISSVLDETVHIGMLEDTEVVYINKKESNQSMRIFTTIGARNPAYCTGVGKVMLAYKNKDFLMEKLPEKFVELTPKTITEKSELIDELVDIRNQGYAIDEEEFSMGLTCVAAPIFDYTGNVKYAISVSGPTIRMTVEKINESIVILKKAAKEISYKLGYKE